MLQLNCKAQNYAWGKLGEDSLVGRIHLKNSNDDAAAIKDTPFAEFWMGDHPNGPSQVLIDKENTHLASVIGDNEFLEKHHGQAVPISALFQLNPAKFLGEKYLTHFPEEGKKCQLAYLFKVLSVRTALSIQAHPNKGLAEKLHIEFPDKYKDPNHKPEFAIALQDNFLACYGFASAELIKKNLAENPVLKEVFPCEEPSEDYLKESVKKMFLELDADDKKDQRTDYIKRLAAHIATVENKSEH